MNPHSFIAPLQSAVKCIAAIAALSMAVDAYADGQASRVRWLEHDYNFGLMLEEEGPKTGHLSFVNEGNSPVTMVRVRPSCGCTSATYDEDPVAPGDTATIVFTYDPEGRPGRFEKSIRVTFADDSHARLGIRGNVLGTDSSLRTFYPIEVGTLRLTEDVVLADKVRFGAVINRFITGYNASTDTIRPQLSAISNGLTIVPSTEVVAPGDLVTYAIAYDSRATEITGPVALSFEVAENDRPEAQRHTVTFRAENIPDIGRYGNDINVVPLIYLAPSPLDLGELIGKQAAKPQRRTVAVTNEGKSVLRVTRVYSDSPAVKAVKLPGDIAPGHTSKIEIEVDPRRLDDGPFRIELKVVSSDPIHPIQTLNITGIYHGTSRK